MKIFKIILFLVFSFNISYMFSQHVNVHEIKIESTDGIVLTADLYKAGENELPFIVMFHQAGYSRGEYVETAKKLNACGFNCLAVDARSGKEVNGIENSAFKQAKEKGLGTAYVDAMPDLKAAIKYVQTNFNKADLYIMGSSYSASLSIILASEIIGISGVIAFSPGEYFKYEGRKIQDYAREALCPVFITSAKGEIGHWAGIYSALPESLAYGFKPMNKGIHGSRALWESTEGSENYWEAVKDFLP